MCQSENCRGFIGLNKKEDDDEKVKKVQKQVKRKVDYQAIIQEPADDLPSNEVIVPRNSKKLTYGSVNIAYKYALPHRPKRRFLLRNFKTLYKHNHLSISRKIKKSRRNDLDTVIERLYDVKVLEPDETVTVTRKGKLLHYVRKPQSWPHKLYAYYDKPYLNRPILIRNIKATNRSQLPPLETRLGHRELSIDQIIDKLKQKE